MGDSSPGTTSAGALGSMPRAELGDPRVRFVRGVCPRAEFNALRERLPRSVRRGVDVVPEGHVGLIVQAVSGVDSLLLAEYGHVRADRDTGEALALLERRLRKRLD
jgi:hypothetical protein